MGDFQVAVLARMHWAPSSHDSEPISGLHDAIAALTARPTPKKEVGAFWLRSSQPRFLLSRPDSSSAFSTSQRRNPARIPSLRISSCLLSHRCHRSSVLAAPSRRPAPALATSLPRLPRCAIPSCQSTNSLLQITPPHQFLLTSLTIGSVPSGQSGRGRCSAGS